MIFFSAPNYLLKLPELQHLIDTNAEFCKRWSLSGLFLYLNGSGLELVEGKKEVIEAYFALSEANKWHSWLIVLGKEQVEQKFFPDYLIAYRLPGAKQLGELQPC